MCYSLLLKDFWNALKPRRSTGWPGMKLMTTFNLVRAHKLILTNGRRNTKMLSYAKDSTTRPMQLIIQINPTLAIWIKEWCMWKPLSRSRWPKRKQHQKRRILWAQPVHQYRFWLKRRIIIIISRRSKISINTHDIHRNSIPMELNQIKNQLTQELTLLWPQIRMARTQTIKSKRRLSTRMRTCRKQSWTRVDTRVNRASSLLEMRWFKNTFPSTPKDKAALWTTRLMQVKQQVEMQTAIKRARMRLSPWGESILQSNNKKDKCRIQMELRVAAQCEVKSRDIWTLTIICWRRRRNRIAVSRRRISKISNRHRIKMLV